MNHNIGRVLAGGLVLAVGVTISACASSGQSEGDAGGAEQLVSMRYLMPFAPNGGEADIYYAQSEGYFADEGLDVEILPGKDSQTAVNQVATGGADIAVVAVKDQIINATKGQVTTAVGNRHWLGTSGVFTPADSGMEDLADLEGANILHSTASIANLLKLTMEMQGLDPSSVEFTTVQSSALASTYVNGQGDALLTAVPGYSSLVQAQRESNVLLLADYGLTLPGYVFVVSPQYLEDHEDNVRGFLTAAYRGMIAAREDLDGAVEAIVKANPALDPEASKLQLEDFTPYICGAEAVEQKLPISAMPEAEYEAGIEVIGQLGEIGDQSVDISAMLTDSFIDTTDESC